MHNNDQFDLPYLLTFIKSYARDYESAQPSIVPTTSSPVEPFYKVTLSSISGFVTRNHEGMLMVVGESPNSFISKEILS
ncbi:hypothetical protein GQ457_09G022270 [Hibiscus cannabinus]